MNHRDIKSDRSGSIWMEFMGLLSVLVTEKVAAVLFERGAMATRVEG
jgi:hypothetical protein